MPQHQAHGWNGFSLIEVVVALVIVALTLGTVLRLVSGAMFSVNRTESYLTALSVAQSRLADIAARHDLRPGNSQGATDGVAWQLSISPFPTAPLGSATALYRIAVSADFRGSRVQLETLLIATISQ